MFDRPKIKICPVDGAVIEWPDYRRGVTEYCSRYCEMADNMSNEELKEIMEQDTEVGHIAHQVLQERYEWEERYNKPVVDEESNPADGGDKQ